MDQIASGVEAMKINHIPRATSKNLDVLAEFEKTKAKNAANFVVIGMRAIVEWKIQSNFNRPCGRWEKHTDGPFAVRP